MEPDDEDLGPRTWITPTRSGRHYEGRREGRHEGVSLGRIVMGTAFGIVLAIALLWLMKVAVIVTFIAALVGMVSGSMPTSTRTHGPLTAPTRTVTAQPQPRQPPRSAQECMPPGSNELNQAVMDCMNGGSSNTPTIGSVGNIFTPLNESLTRSNQKMQTCLFWREEYRRSRRANDKLMVMEACKP